MTRKVKGSRKSVVETTTAETTRTEVNDADPAAILIPRPARRRQKSKLDRGLPDDAALERLAEAYLERQRRNYPVAAANSLIPASCPETILVMVEDYKERHRGGPVEVQRIPRLLAALEVSKAGGAYLRFSCDNSNSVSILDQLMNSLDKSLTEGRFIPWEYIYSDYAVTGLDASRRGYSSYKKLLSDKTHVIETTYIDDFTRASRDEVEWWYLAELSREKSKRLIGASDNFDLSSPIADMQMMMYGLFSKLLIKGLREKVARGMKGAAERGTTLGRLPLGFTRRQKVDKAGNPMFRRNRLPLTERCIDPETAAIRLRILEYYVIEGWSASKITKHFNLHRVDDWEGWSVRTITDLIYCPSAIGAFFWNKTRRQFNTEKRRYELVTNPRSDWKYYYSPELAIVPCDLWKAGRRKLAESRRPSKSTGRPKSRNEKEPSTLFSGTLFCGCCENELKLIRSAGNDKQLGTVNGSVGVHGCKLPGSRSSRIVEECLLGYLREKLLSSAVVAELVTNANSFLEKEAKKPIPQTAKVKKRIAERELQIKRLVHRIATTDNQVVANRCDAEIERLAKQNKDDQALVSAAQATERRKLERLDLDNALKLLDDLHTTLNEDITIAGPAIRELTGPIRVFAEPIDAGRGNARWIARFTPQVAALLQKLSQSECGQFAASSLPEATAVEVVLGDIPLYQRLAKDFQRSRDSGLGPMEIAAKYKVGHHTLMDGLYFADTGQPRKSRPKSQSNRMRYKEISPEVVRLIDQEEMQINAVAAKFGVSESMVRKAYDYLHPDTPTRQVGAKLHRQRKSQRIYDAIRRLTAEGADPKQIAEEAGCCERTVKREQKRLADAECDNS